MSDFPRIYAATPDAETFRDRLALTLDRDVALRPDDQIDVRFSGRRRFYINVRALSDEGSSMEVDAVVIPHGIWVFGLRSTTPASWIVQLDDIQRRLLNDVPVELYEAPISKA